MDYKNTSGHGDFTEIPVKLKRWNWWTYYDINNIG